MSKTINSIVNGLNPVTIDAFKSTIGGRGGLAPTNRFVVHMPLPNLFNFNVRSQLPSIFSGDFSSRDLFNDPRSVGILCESCSLPGKSLTTFDHPFQNFRQSIKYPSGYVNSDITFTFLLTNDFYMKKVFDKWLDTIVNPRNYTIAYDRDFKVDMQILQLNQRNIPIYGVSLRNAFPTNIADVSLDNNSNNSIQKLSVTITYEEQRPEDIIASTVSQVQSTLKQVTKSVNDFDKRFGTGGVAGGLLNKGTDFLSGIPLVGNAIKNLF
jgi:hypothetical protein